MEDVNLIMKYIEIFEPLDSFKYHTLITVFGKNKVNELINCYTKKQLEKDFSYENQKRLWECFGYYYATLDDSVFTEMAIKNLDFQNELKESRKNSDGLSLEDEKRYGYRLLSRDYITICCDEDKNMVDMMKVFASVRHVEVRDFILKRFNDLYNTIDRVSNYDKEMKSFLENYKQMCSCWEVPKLAYQGEVLEEDILLEQVEMYIRYSVAKDKFIRNNKLLIYESSRQMKCYLSNEDLFIEGYFALLRSVEKYDVRMGYVFSSYAIKSIKSWLYRYLNSCSSFGIMSVHATEIGYKMKQFSERFFVRFGRQPSEMELASEFNMSVKRVRELQKSLADSNYVSLDMDVYSESGEKRDSLLGEFICDEGKSVIDQAVEAEYIRYILKLMDSKLSERERMILLERAKGRTFNDISKNIHVTRERVRQIEADALRKIRRAPGVRV